MNTETKETTTPTLEQQVGWAVRESVAKAIHERMSSYGSPLFKFIDEAVAKKSAQIAALVDESVEGALTGDFREEVKKACTAKLARVIISKTEGEIEKTANDLRQSPEFRAKLTLAVSAVVSEFTKPR